MEKKRERNKLKLLSNSNIQKVKMEEMNFLGGSNMSYTQLLMAASQEVLKVPFFVDVEMYKGKKWGK